MENLVNDHDTQLNGAIDDSQTSIIVDANTSVSNDFRIRIDDELMLVTANPGTTWTVTRGIEGTTPAAHADNAYVFVVITSAGMEQWGDDRYLPLAHDTDPVSHEDIRKLLAYSLSTGIISGGILSINAGDNTKFDYTSGVALFVDTFTDPANPTISLVPFAGATGVTDTFLATSATTFLYVTSDGVVHQTDTALTFAEARDWAHFGEMGHPNNVNQATANNTAYYTPGATLQVQDLMVALGMMTLEGQEITANGANRNLNVSAGSIFALGANYATNLKDPHVKAIGARTAFTFVRALRSGAFVPVTTVDTDNYDNAGVLTAVPNNDWVSHRFYLLANGTIAMQYGQQAYPTLAAARTNLGTEAFVLNPILTNLIGDGVAVLRTIIIVKESVTTLNSAANAYFVDMGRFGTAAIGAGSGTTDLQGAYDNSLNPEILTNATNGALSVRRGSAADSDNVLEIQNNAGSTTAAITGAGNITGNNLSGTNTGDQIAATVPAADAGGYFAGTDVEAQLQEIGLALGSFQTVNQTPYKAKTVATSGDPGIRFVLWNNATQISATSLHISETNNNNVDITFFLEQISTGDTIILQSPSDAADYQEWLVAGAAVDQGAYFTVAVTYVGGGYSFGGNDPMYLLWVHPGSSVTPPELPTGGAAGDVLTKVSSDTGDVEWTTPAGSFNYGLALTIANNVFMS